MRKKDLINVCERFIIKNPGCSTWQIVDYLISAKQFNDGGVGRMRYHPSQQQVATLLRGYSKKVYNKNRQSGEVRTHRNIAEWYPR